MDKNEKINNEKMFQEGDFVFPFKKFKKMAEMMKSCCTGEGGMADCCSMMRKMMGQEGKGEKKQETEKPSKERE
jgi:hypothetical protein